MSLPKVLIRDAVELAGALQREALQTIPRHRILPSPLSTFLGEGQPWREGDSVSKDRTPGHLKYKLLPLACDILVLNNE